jgi:hypothetical protein
LITVETKSKLDELLRKMTPQQIEELKTKFVNTAPVEEIQTEEPELDAPPISSTTTSMEDIENELDALEF